MRPIKRIIITLLLLAAGLFASCSGDAAQQAEIELSGTLTPTATVDPSGYQAVDSRACLLSDWPSQQAEQRRVGTTQWLQGNLLAWRPGLSSGKGELAYLAPTDRSSWFTGELMLARGQDMKDHIPLAPGVLANGDLTWSPDGNWLAFLAFRPNEGIFTVMAASADGTRQIDLFPTDLARTDGRTSQKAVIGWLNDHTVQVMASCGEECRQAYNMDISAPPQLVLTPTPVDDFMQLKNDLQIRQHVLTVTPDAYPKNMRTAHWSPDEMQVAYLDRRGILWMLSIDEKINYILDIGLRDVYETQWSAASDALAIRAEDRIYVFQTPCQH